MRIHKPFRVMDRYILQAFVKPLVYSILSAKTLKAALLSGFVSGFTLIIC